MQVLSRKKFPLLALCLSLFASGLMAKVPELKDLDAGNPGLKRLRIEIARNLRAVSRGQKLAIPLRVLSYRVKKGEHFYTIMARVSQDTDTLVSLNGLANPNAVVAGQVLLIPNARGRFVSKSTSLPDRYKDRLARLPAIKSHIFLPGERMPLLERSYFRGEGFLHPLPYGKSRVSSRFGRRRDPFRNKLTFHGGLDLAVSPGTAVFASRSGKVLRSRKGVQGYGTLIVIQHKYGYSSWYGHLSQTLVQKGDTVKAGQKIGLSGETGRATGPHLHFEIRKHGQKRNPIALLRKH